MPVPLSNELSRAGVRASQVLAFLAPLQERCSLWVAAGAMGEDSALAAHWTPDRVLPVAQPSGAADTRRLAAALSEEGVDLLLFAGGDGTARDIADAVGDRQLVLGIPAGVKMHSGVFAINPPGAAALVEALLKGALVQVQEAEVKDIDEVAARQGIVKTRHYGELKVPESGRYLQHVKCGGREVEELVLEEIAASWQEDLDEDVLYVVGPGSTTKFLFDKLGQPKTLLGFDLLVNKKCVASDIDAERLATWLERFPECRLVLTFIPGQGHLIGRGNQQLTPEILRRIGKGNLLIVGTHEKLKTLEGRPLLMDSGDPQLDSEWVGMVEILTGYHHRVLYPLE